MVQAHFLKDSNWNIEVTRFEEDYIQRYIHDKEIVCTKLLSDIEWNEIVSFPGFEREKINEFLKSKYLESSIQSRVLWVLTIICSRFSSQNINQVTQI